ncbi:hypothetical protein M8494_26285 [Serratia ureilytica]
MTDDGCQNAQQRYGGAFRRIAGLCVVRSLNDSPTMTRYRRFSLQLPARCQLAPAY